MMKITEIVQQTLTTGVLTIDAENQLRGLLSTHYELEDFRSFIQLQLMACDGLIRQESRSTC